MIRKYLEASTAHITPEDSDKLAVLVCFGGAPSTVVGHGYGYFVNVPFDEVDEVERQWTGAGLSDSFILLLRYAREKDCYWIYLDADGDIIEELITYDW